MPPSHTLERGLLFSLVGLVLGLLPKATRHPHRRRAALQPYPKTHVPLKMSCNEFLQTEKDLLERVYNGSPKCDPCLILEGFPGRVYPAQVGPSCRKVVIAALYEASAQDLLDSELVDEAGYALLARCQSMLDVAMKYEGKVRCAGCREVIYIAGDKVKSHSQLKLIGLRGIHALCRAS